MDILSINNKYKNRGVIRFLIKSCVKYYKATNVRF